MRERVELLLRTQDQPDSPFDGRFGGSVGDTVPAVPGYEIHHELGRGGVGVVYKARQLRLNRLVALKMLSYPRGRTGEADLTRVRTAAEAIARLQYSNIAQIYDIGEHDGLPFLAFEYCAGGSLKLKINGTPWPARRAAELIEPLAQGVDYAHRLGIVHGNLQPRNIVLRDDGTPMITDFGLAKSLATDCGLTWTGSITGSPSYMAPEQARGIIGPLADVYALGAILYELLTGRPPFLCPTVLETLEQARTIEPVPPSRLVPSLPRDVETITLKCLQKDPGQRYESAAALAQDLRRFLEGRSLLARPVNPVEKVWRWCRRNPMTAAMAALILVFALAIGTVLASTAAIWPLTSMAVMLVVLFAYQNQLTTDRAKAKREPRRQIPGSASGETAEGRRLNFWLERAGLPLIVDRTVKVGVDIGPPLEGAAEGGPSPTIDWRGVDHVDLIIALCGADVSVSPPSHCVRLPRVGKSKPVLFEVTPRQIGSVEIHVDVLRPDDYALLEGYRVCLDVIEDEVAQTA